MSYHVRTYEGGGADHDPRRKTYAEFHCDVCGENEDVDVTGRLDTFRFNDPRRCPHCHSLGKDDKIISLKKEIEELTQNKANIDVEIERLTNELESLKSTEVDH